MTIRSTVILSTE
ncbi:hypothetical protein LINPERHAP2_LOCUS8914 [Linum perenne]